MPGKCRTFLPVTEVVGWRHSLVEDIVSRLFDDKPMFLVSQRQWFVVFCIITLNPCQIWTSRRDLAVVLYGVQFTEPGTPVSVTISFNMFSLGGSVHVLPSGVDWGKLRTVLKELDNLESISFRCDGHLQMARMGRCVSHLEFCVPATIKGLPPDFVCRRYILWIARLPESRRPICPSPWGRRPQHARHLTRLFPLHARRLQRLSSPTSTTLHPWISRKLELHLSVYCVPLIIAIYRDPVIATTTSSAPF
ncbi:hypothetical protein EUX98_g4502 [Antrodiella citrinella]|uniref:Uncharacterized protein n=1 Tax=Antrodiella citrinella TaxID=2447956 RepID=A0A4S4MTY7_9APHY|nr:hypothetical protein EUX98_g4502 [Antrodiella citrinella]